MKKIFLPIVAAIICLMIMLFLQQKNEQAALDQATQIQTDYEKVDQVVAALKKASQQTPVKKSVNPTRREYYDLRLIYQKNDALSTALKSELGENFDTKIISTGEYIFVGLTVKGNPEVYIGSPASDESNMVYPDWNYTALPAK